MSEIRPAIALNLSVKLLLLGLALFPLVAPDLPQFQGKALAARAATYSLVPFMLPALWWLRGRPASYPHLIDTLIAVPFIVDSGGNALDLDAKVEVFDLFAHWLNWVFLVTAFGAMMSTLDLGRLNVGALSLGFGAVSHICWELAEYALSKLGSSGLQLTYDNTMQDFIFSLLGSLTGALVVMVVVWPRRPSGGGLFRWSRRSPV